MLQMIVIMGIGTCISVQSGVLVTFRCFDKSRFPNPERLAVETYGFVGRNACKQLAAKCTMKALTAKARIQRA
jgi:hypothetical protein